MTQPAFAPPPPPPKSPAKVYSTAAYVIYKVQAIKMKWTKGLIVVPGCPIRFSAIADALEVEEVVPVPLQTPTSFILTKNEERG